MYKAVVLERDDEKKGQYSRVSFASDYVLRHSEDIFEYDVKTARKVTYMSTDLFGIVVETIYEGEIIDEVTVYAVEALRK